MRALLLLGLVGCDAVFGLNGREENRDAATGNDTSVDDAVVDMSIDARSLCPTTGAPSFSPDLNDIVAGCIDYTTSAMTGMALMTCSDVLVEGPIASNNVQTSPIVPQNGQTIRAPRLAPEGDTMFVTSADGATQSIRVYKKVASGWQYLATPPGLPTAPANTTLMASVPTSSPNRRIIVARQAVLSEYAEDGNGTWTLVRDYTTSDLGVSVFVQPSLSPDGLHLVFSAVPVGSIANEARYAYRPNTAVKFDTSVRIELGIADSVLYPHLSADCGRLFLWTNNSVFWVQT